MENFNEKFAAWMEAKAKFDHYKSLENKLRIEICDELLENKTTGTHNFTDFDGYRVKAVKKVSHNIDKEVLGFIYDEMSAEEQEAINFKPELSVSKYKKLEDHSVIDNAIIVKPAMPSLDIKLDEE